jgi:cellulose synthase/poly-beta-1,6-N-acetylglucosamine synthase-like glycosyltransferase
VDFCIFLFWFSGLILFWAFIGYPLAVNILSRIYAKTWQKGPYTGSVSMIIAAHNEEEVIRGKVDNCMALDFTPAKAEIIIVSDGSTDKTNAILSEFEGRSERLRIITYPRRAGKANALNLAVTQANGEILIFGDANVMAHEKGCQHLLAPFADPDVGVVCGHVLVRPRGTQEVAAEGLYMRFEAAVQLAEALLGSMVGVDGALFAMRRELFRPLAPETILDDFSLSMEAPLAGQRIVYEQDALAVEEVVPSAANEFKRKSRIVAGGWQFLKDFFKSGRSLSLGMWCAFISHKILRWLGPFFLLSLLITNLFLLGTSSYRLLFGSQMLFYLLAAVGFAIKALRRNFIVYLPYYFCVVNLAAMQGFLRFLFNGQKAMWSKVDRV